MILRPKSLPRQSGGQSGPLPGATTVPPAAPVPTWLRRAVPDAQSLAGKDIDDVTLAAGAVIATLDAVVRRQERWAGTWRQRLALAAAAMTVKHVGRVEDEAALRDAVLLTKPGNDIGPAGRMLLAWRRLATRPMEELLTEKNLGAVLEEFGHAPDDEMVGDLVGKLRRLAAGGMVETLTGAFITAERYGFGRAVGAWFADALLAQRPGWKHAVPLLDTEATLGVGAARPRRASTVVAVTGSVTESERAKILLAV